MQILIIGTLYEPDLGPSAPLFTLLSECLVQLGHKVTVITMVPHYPIGFVPVDYRGRMFWQSVEQGVEVIRIGLPSVNRKNLRLRLIQFICYQLGATLVGMRNKCDVVLAASPSLTVLLPYAWQIVIRKKPAVYSIQDVYPDVGIKLGIFRRQSIISLVANLERYCLKHAAIIHIVSDSFRPALRKLGVAESRMHLIYDWVDTELVRPIPKDNCFSREYNLYQYFVILYAGNIGLSQDLEHTLTTANLLEDQKDVRFVFVGDGTGLSSLQDHTVQLGLTNVQFIPFQPRPRIPEVLASADISLIMLRRGIGSDSLPSKTFSIMASGRPIIASVDEESETWKLVQRAEAGLCVPPEDPNKLVEAILTLKQDKELCERLGRNGRRWAEQHHSPPYAAEQFEKLLCEALGSQSHS